MQTSASTIGHRYRLLDSLGQGGMGTVFRAYDRLTGQHIALKRILTRPDKLMFASRPDTDSNLRGALDYAHQHNVIHRDIKPSNIMIENTVEHESSTNPVYLVDFGLSKLIGAKSLTATGVWLGTPEYMSPEQGLDQPFTPRTDVYALTIVLYRMLTGRLPFKADTPEATAFKQVEEPPPSPRKWRADFPTALENVLMRGIAKDPDDRFETASQLEMAYSQVMHAIGSDASRQEYWPADS